MSWQAWAQAATLLGLVFLSTPLLGAYIARVFGGGTAPGDRVFLPVERALYRLGGVDPEREQPWQRLRALAARVQPGLGPRPLPAPARAGRAPAEPDPRRRRRARARLQHGGQLRHEHELAELRRRVDDEPSHPDGRPDRAELRLRGRRHRRRDRARARDHTPTERDDRELLGRPHPVDDAHPPAARARARPCARRARRRPDAPRPRGRAHTVAGATQAIFRGPVASQEAIKELGTNGGGPLNANSAHPFENPSGLTNLLEMWALLAIPFALTFAFGRLVGDRRQGWAIFAAMLALWVGSAALATWAEVDGNPQVHALGAAGANMEGKEVRFGAPASALFAASTTGTSTGAVDAAHDSFTPLGGAVPLVNMMLGEVSPGGVGVGALRHARLRPARRLHRRADGRADARVPRQEDPGGGDEARRALPPRRARR